MVLEQKDQERRVVITTKVMGELTKLLTVNVVWVSVGFKIECDTYPMV